MSDDITTCHTSLVLEWLFIYNRSYQSANMPLLLPPHILVATSIAGTDIGNDYLGGVGCCQEMPSKLLLATLLPSPSSATSKEE